MIQITAASSEHRTLLWNLHQKYLYEMTNYYEDEMDREGNYHYGYFDEYFTDPARTALLIHQEGHLMGFAMINPYSYIGARPDHVLAEFTIFPMYRRRHLAAAAAARILTMYSGRWEIKFHERNTAAKGLWEQVTAPYHPARHRFRDTETVLSFSTL